jgi:hypothetical protein
LRRMSSETGGQVFKVDAAIRSMKSSARSGRDALPVCYFLPASQSQTDGSYHKIDIKLANKDYKPQARKGHYAVEPRTNEALLLFPRVLPGRFSGFSCTRARNAAVRPDASDTVVSPCSADLVDGG